MPTAASSNAFAIPIFVCNLYLLSCKGTRSRTCAPRSPSRGWRSQGHCTSGWTTTRRPPITWTWAGSARTSSTEWSISTTGSRSSSARYDDDWTTLLPVLDPPTNCASQPLHPQLIHRPHISLPIRSSFEIFHYPLWSACRAVLFVFYC